MGQCKVLNEKKNIYNLIIGTCEVAMMRWNRPMKKRGTYLFDYQIVRAVFFDQKRNTYFTYY